VLVVGGGPAGAAAAIYAARKGIRTGVVAERFGGQVMDTWASRTSSRCHTEGPKLVAALEQHVKEYAVDVMNLQRAGKLIPASEVAACRRRTGKRRHAARPRRSSCPPAPAGEMNVPGEKEYKAKGVCFCPHCDGPLFKGKRVAVIGGGNSGVEAAIDLAGIVAHVTLLEFADAACRCRAAEQAQQPAQRHRHQVGADHRSDRRRPEGQRPALQGPRIGRRKAGRTGRHLRADRPLPNTDWLKARSS
jgi:alkyl hydroperoxide reductase subunit AhpF